MSQYVPPTSEQLPPPGASRQRAASHTDRYVPDEYRSRPPMQQQPSAPVVMPSQGQPKGPTFAGQPITGPLPVPNAGYYGSSPSRLPGVAPPASNAGYYGSSPGYFGTSPGMQNFAGTPQTTPYPQDEPSPGFTGPFHPQPQRPIRPHIDETGHMRPPPDQRRASASSTRSHRSHHSKHSERSHGSRRDSHHHHHRRHSEDSYDYDDSDHRRSRESRRDGDRRRSADDRDMKPLKRTNTHRPSWGDTIYSAFSVIKDALGPRDKY